MKIAAKRDRMFNSPSIAGISAVAAWFLLLTRMVSNFALDALPREGLPAVTTNSSITVSATTSETNAVIQLAGLPADFDVNSIKLTFDRTNRTPTIQRNGNVAEASLDWTTFSGADRFHQIELSYLEHGEPKRLSWKIPYPDGAGLIGSSVNKAALPRGFYWSVFKNARQTNTTIALAKDRLASRTDLPGGVLVNEADRNFMGSAIGPANQGDRPEDPVKFEIPGVVNINTRSDRQEGNFVPDAPAPGLPTLISPGGVIVEIITTVAWPDHPFMMGIRCTGTFRTEFFNSRGFPYDNQLLTEFEGPSETEVLFKTPTSGWSAVRTIWAPPAGGGHIEWFTINQNGVRVLLNDTNGLACYRDPDLFWAPYIKAIYPKPSRDPLVRSSSSLSMVLADGAFPIDEKSVDFYLAHGFGIPPPLDGVISPFTVRREGKTVIVSQKLETLRVPTEGYGFRISYSVAGVKGSWSLGAGVSNLRNIVLGKPVVVGSFDSIVEGGLPNNWHAENFTTPMTPGENLNDFTSDSYKGWLVVSKNRLENLRPGMFQPAADERVNDQAVTNLATGNL